MRLMEFTNDRGMRIMINLDQVINISESVSDAKYTLIKLVGGVTVLVEDNYINIRDKCRQYITHD